VWYERSWVEKRESKEEREGIFLFSPWKSTAELFWICTDAHRLSNRPVRREEGGGGEGGEEGEEGQEHYSIQRK
jgi:hypothetical protein